MERNTHLVGQSTSFLDAVERASRAAPLDRPVLGAASRRSRPGDYLGPLTATSAPARAPCPLSELASAAAEAADLAERGEEQALAGLRTQWQDEVEGLARSSDYRERAVAYRAIGQFRYRQKAELLRRGLEDESPACRGSALISLELLSRDHPGLVNDVRPLPARACEPRREPGRPPPVDPVPRQRVSSARDDPDPQHARRRRRAGQRAEGRGEEDRARRCGRRARRGARRRCRECGSRTGRCASASRRAGSCRLR